MLKFSLGLGKNYDIACFEVYPETWTVLSKEKSSRNNPSPDWPAGEYFSIYLISMGQNAEIHPIMPAAPAPAPGLKLEKSANRFLFRARLFHFNVYEARTLKGLHPGKGRPVQSAKTV